MKKRKGKKKEGKKRKEKINARFPVLFERGWALRSRRDPNRYGEYNMSMGKEVRPRALVYASDLR